MHYAQESGPGIGDVVSYKAGRASFDWTCIFGRASKGWSCIIYVVETNTS